MDNRQFHKQGERFQDRRHHPVPSLVSFSEGAMVIIFSAPYTFLDAENPIHAQLLRISSSNLSVTSRTDLSRRSGHRVSAPRSVPASRSSKGVLP